MKAGTVQEKEKASAEQTAIKFYKNKWPLHGLWGWIGNTKYNLERYAYTLHRITGILLTAYVIMHIFVSNTRIGGLAVWESYMLALQNPAAHIGEFIVIIALAYHGFNGIRLIIGELGFSIGKPKRPIYPYKPSSIGRRPRALFWALMIIAAVIVILGGLELFIYTG